MIKCKCIQKFRDKNGNIKRYRVQDEHGQSIDLKPEQLKMAIFQNKLDIVNLKLTSDSRLIDNKEYNSVDKIYTFVSNELGMKGTYWYEEDEGDGGIVVHGFGDIKFKKGKDCFLYLIIFKKTMELSFCIMCRDEKGETEEGDYNCIWVENYTEADIKLVMQIYKKLKSKQILTEDGRIIVSKGKIIENDLGVKQQA